MPDIKDIRLVNQALSNLSQQYRNREMIADEVFPVVPVRRDSDVYYVYGLESFKSERTRRAPRTAAPVISWGLTTATYAVQEHWLSDRIDDAERRNADAGLNLDFDSVQTLTDKLLLGREERVATLLTDTNNWTNDSPSNGWDEEAGTPIDDVRAAVAGIIMMRPNTMILPRPVFDALRHSKQILDRMPSERGLITLDILKDFFEMARILVAGAVHNTAAEGQTAVMDYVYGDSVWIGYVAPRPGLRQASAGYTFRSLPFTVRKWREEAEHSDALECGHADADVITAAGLGTLLTNVLQA